MLRSFDIKSPCLSWVQIRNLQALLKTLLEKGGWGKGGALYDFFSLPHRVSSPQSAARTDGVKS